MDAEWQRRFECFADAVLVGDARETLQRLEGPFDLVFIDADKPNYSNYYRLVFDMVRPGGFIIARRARLDRGRASLAQW